MREENIRAEVVFTAPVTFHFHLALSPGAGKDDAGRLARLVETLKKQVLTTVNEPRSPFVPTAAPAGAQGQVSEAPVHPAQAETSPAAPSETPAPAQVVPLTRDPDAQEAAANGDSPG